VLDIPMTEIGLQCPRIVPLVGQSEAAGVPEHVRLEACRRASALYKPRKACRGERRAALRREESPAAQIIKAVTALERLVLTSEQEEIKKTVSQRGAAIRYHPVDSKTFEDFRERTCRGLCDAITAGPWIAFAF
jgi:hypothetical protein